MGRIPVFILIILGLCVLLAAGCGKISGAGGGIRYTGDKGGEPVEMSKILFFSFSYSSGSYMNSGSFYSAELKDEGAEVMVRQDGIDMSEVPAIITDKAFLDRIEEILEKYDVKKWNGFHMSAEDVMDGDSFSISVRMDNGQSLSAGGYMAWPDNYGNVRAELDTLFVDLYEEHYPNKQKALKKYFETQLLPGTTFNTETEIEYPYIRASEENLGYGRPEFDECIVSRLIGNFTGGDEDRRDPRDMLVVRLHTDNVEGSVSPATVMSLELYRIDDDLTVKKLAETVIDPEFSWNEGVYGSLFTHELEDRCLIGYNIVYSHKASVEDDAYVLRLFEYVDGEFKLLADEVTGIPKDHDDWTIDDIKTFTDAAEEYGFGVSIGKWKDKPWDPMVDRYDRDYTLADIYTKNNYTGDFYETFKNTQVGGKIGDYTVKGTIRGLTWYD